MKCGEYQNKKGEIADKINESDLVKKCREVALQGNMTYKDERSYSTHVKWEFKDGESGIEIFYESGYYVMGSGSELTVRENDDIVFQVYDKPLLKKRAPGKEAVPLNNNHEEFVTRYQVGKWEKSIQEFQADVEGPKLDDFNNNFKI